MNRIKALRQEQGMRQTDLAASAGISQPFLHDLENGNRSAKPETYERIASALGVSVQDLFEEEKVG